MNSTARQERYLTILSSLFLGLQVSLLIYIFILGWYNPILVDDYCFLRTQRLYGMFGSVKWWYTNWQGRFLPQLFTNFFIWVNQTFGNTILLTFLHFGIYFWGISRVLKVLNLKISQNEQVNRFYVLGLKIMLFNSLVLFNFEPSTFFWINVSTMYFGGLFFLVLGIAELLNSKSTIMSYIILSFSFCYVGCSSEHVGLFTLIILAFAIALKKFSFVKDISFISQISFNKLCVAIIICLISFVIMVMAPGNDIRRASFPESDIINAFAIAAYSFLRVNKPILFNLFTYAFVGCPFLLLGVLNRRKPNRHRLMQLIRFSIPTIAVLIYVFMLPTAYAISDLGPKRALTYLTGFIVVTTAILFYYFGLYSRLSKIVGLSLVLSSCIFFVIITCVAYTKQLPDSIAFAKSEKERIDKLLLLKENKNKEIIALNKLIDNDGNMYLNREISEDPNNWHNECICDGLNLDFKIKLKGQELNEK